MKFRLTVCLLLLSVGCGPRGLSPGNTLPAIHVEGWTNGESPETDQWQGKVVVLNVFGSW